MSTQAQVFFGAYESCPRNPGISLSQQRLLLTSWLVVSDLFAIGLAFGLAYWIRFRLHVTLAPEVVGSPSFYTGLTVALASLFVSVFALFRLYDVHSLLGGISEYSRLFNACTIALMLVVLATFLVPEFVISRLWMLSAWILSFLLTAANRLASRRLVYWLRRRGCFLTPAVVIGTNQEAQALAKELSRWESSGLRLLGIVATEDPSSGSWNEQLPLLGGTDQIDEIIADHGVEVLVVAITSIDRDRLLGLCERVNAHSNLEMRLSSGLFELLTTGVDVRRFGTVPLVSIDKMRLRSGEAFVKSTIEYLVAVLTLFTIWPIMLLIGILIRIDSRGPALYRRKVLGVSGQSFDAFKFRTMCVNGNEILRNRVHLRKKLQTEHKLVDDPRVTRIGYWLRRYSLDELPQIFNVLLGQMSLVGPRMITAEEADKYGHHRLNLFTVKPGITGLWQVSGRSDLSYQERVQLDMYYIRNYSIWLDLQILFVQTPGVVLRARGAY